MGPAGANHYSGRLVCCYTLVLRAVVALTHLGALTLRRTKEAFKRPVVSLRYM